MKQYLDEIRQTYIILYVKDGTRYIFNRSIQWNCIMNTKNIQPIIEVLGKEAIDHFVIKMNEEKNNAIKSIEDLTNTFSYDDTIFSILEVHPEWKNISRSDQNEINVRKKELCVEYNAVDRVDQFTDGQGLDLQIAKFIKKEFKRWLIDIYYAIGDYAKLINEEIVNTTLGMTKESLIKDINNLRNEKIRLENKIKENTKKLGKQNFIIDNHLRYIKGIPANVLGEIKSLIAYGKYC